MESLANSNWEIIKALSESVNRMCGIDDSNVGALKKQEQSSTRTNQAWAGPNQTVERLDQAIERTNESPRTSNDLIAFDVAWTKQRR